jgi:hypothetical protein
MQAFDLNLVGFVLPTIASIAIILLLARIRKFNISRNGLVYYFAVVVTVTGVLAVLFWNAPDPKSLTIPETWAELFAVFSGGLYTALFMRRRLITIGMAEAYALGTISAGATDAIRTFLLPLPVVAPVVHWGGGGIMDLDFQLGIAMMSIFALAAFLDALRHRQLVEKLIGSKGALLFWTELKKEG